MKVKKRDNTVELFQFSKIENAINKAFQSCGYDTVDEEVLNCVKETYDENNDEIVNVEDIQDTIEMCLMNWYPTVAKSYIIYRYNHKLIRENKDKIIKGLTQKLMAKNVENQNANVDEYSFGGRMGEASRLVTKNYALDYCMSKKSRKNHLSNEIYIHNLIIVA